MIQARRLSLGVGHCHQAVVMWLCVVLTLALSTCSVSSERILRTSTSIPRKPDFVDIPATFDSSAFDNKFYLHNHGVAPQAPSSICLPEHIHLSQSSDVMQQPQRNTNNNGGDYEIDMTLSFTLDYKRCRNAIPTVYYGQDFIMKKSVVKATEKEQFNYSSPRVGGFFESNWIYHVVLPNLRGGRQQTWYKIQVEDEAATKAAAATNIAPPPHSNITTTMVRRGRNLQDKNQKSSAHNLPSTTTATITTPTMTFLTPPLPGEPTTLALIGDLGQTDNSTKTMYHIFRDAFNTSVEFPMSMMLCAGDMSYADGDPQRWPSWFALMEPLLRRVPLHVGAGNHEIECDNVTKNIFIQYEHYFRMPNRIGPAETIPVTDEYRKTLWNEDCATPSAFQGTYNYGNAFYSFQHGLVHIIVLSPYSDTSVGSIQYQWFEYQLTKVVDRSITPWLLVSFHTPFYTTFVGHNDEIESVTMKDSMEPLLVKYGVNLVVSGHDHAYMRTKSLAYGKVDPTGRSPIYLTVGAGGNREQHSRSYKNETHPEPWVAKRDRYEYGYGNLFVANATHARFKWVRDGTTTVGIQDDVWLNNPHALTS